MCFPMTHPEMEARLDAMAVAVMGPAEPLNQEEQAWINTLRWAGQPEFDVQAPPFDPDAGPGMWEVDDDAWFDAETDAENGWD